MSALNIAAASAFGVIFILAMWQGKKFLAAPLWVKLTIALPVALGMFLWIWQLNRVATKQEPVWADTGVEWTRDQLPLGINVEKDLRGQATNDAINLWNNAAGCQVFTQTTGDQPWNIEVVIGDYNAEHAGRAWKSTTGRIKIEVNDPGQIGQQYLIVAHELGHALDLAHDPRPNSVMHNGVQAYADKFPLPGVTQKDSAALYKRYCQ